MINLKEERKKAGMTQQQLADKAGNIVTRNQIHNIEHGKTRVSIKTAQALADVLNVNWTSFFETETAKAVSPKITETR